jgi:hypothetical protein
VINLHIFHSVSLVQVRTWPSKNVSATLVLLIARTCRSTLSNCPSVSISTAQSSAGDCVPSPTMFCCLFVFSGVMSLRIGFGFRRLRHYLLFCFQLNHRYLVLLAYLWIHNLTSLCCQFFLLGHFPMGGLFLLCFLWCHCWHCRFLFWLVHKLSSLEMRHTSVADFLDCLSL